MPYILISTQIRLGDGAHNGRRRIFGSLHHGVPRSPKNHHTGKQLLRVSCGRTAETRLRQTRQVRIQSRQYDGRWTDTGLVSS
ncbi:hypothetical protein PO909_012204 [Leuciscus waleckii]